MAAPEKNLVLRSIETPDGQVCVDIFRRPDGTHGFAAFRRDSEDGRGWYALGADGGLAFGSEEEALAEAARQYPWVGAVLRG